jgi:hypothetical protein
MHPWMLEQLGREHRKDLLALATPRTRRSFFLAKRRRRQTQPTSAAASAASLPAPCPANVVSA